MCLLAPKLWISFAFVIFSLLFSVNRCAPPPIHSVEAQFDVFDLDTDGRPGTIFPGTTRVPYWKSYTPTTTDYGKNSINSEDTFILLLFAGVLPILIFIFVIICLNYNCSETCSYNSYDSYYDNFYAPSTNRINTSRSEREPVRTHSSPTSNRRENTELTFVNLLASYSERINFPRNETTLPSSDKPPDYTAVVGSDLLERDTRYPAVNPQPESPPPNYNEDTLPKF